MNILEAVELMKIGKSVRRSSWVSECRVFMELGKANFNNIIGSTLHGVPVSFFGGESLFDATIMPSLKLSQGNVISHAQILLEDVVANDWEVYGG